LTGNTTKIGPFLIPVTILILLWCRDFRLKSSMRIYALMNLDDSGGVDLDEFQPFAERNDGALGMAHCFLERMRSVVFGRDFW
jgi:hypothetical protein